ncbi:hypothetical protein [Nocardia sp. NPDC049149]|uniref:hypothetical protein n=1 Tax=Nocardia sp. NPDC049149 TaxID=3364315 RepID=UPI003711A73B
MTNHQPTKIAGVEHGTAWLAAATCLALIVGVAALTASVAATSVAAVSIVAGLALVLTILPRQA